MLAGEIDRKDGLADLIVGVTTEEGPAILVFEGPAGALNSAPEVVMLKAAATALAIGRFDDDVFFDLAIGEDRRLRVLRGRNNKLQRLDGSRSGIGAAFVDDIAEFESPIMSIVAGYYVGDTRDGQELAVLTEDGTLSLLVRTPDARAWRTEGERRGLVQSGGSGALVTARVSGLPKEELVVLDRRANRLHVVFGEVGAPAPLTRSLSSPLEGAPVAAIPMRLNGDAQSDLVILQEGVSVPAIAASESSSSIIVNATSDSGPTIGDGLCQLSEAIRNANVDGEFSGGDCAAGTGADTIRFSVTAVDVFAPLPSLADPGDSVDGTTACGTPPCVELRGNGISGSGLRITASAITVRGLIISGFNVLQANDEGGIFVTGGGSSIVEGNTIRSQNAGSGIRIKESPSNTIGGTVIAARNVVSENTVGIFIEGSAGLGSSNKLFGNTIGFDGPSLPGNSNRGIEVIDTMLTEIGGTTPGAGNVILDNGGIGLFVHATGSGLSDGTIVQGNKIGVDATGTTGLGNDSGIEFRSTSFSVIGGSSPAARNVVSGHQPKPGILIFADLMTYTITTDNVIQGNYVGTDVTGTVSIPNRPGVEVWGIDNVVGGTSPGEGNLVSGNWGHGVEVHAASGNRVEGNLIGTDVTGTVDLGNSWDGVRLESAFDAIIGGTTPGARNVVSGNDIYGINIQPGTTGAQVIGNYVGTDVTGTSGLGNSSAGVNMSYSDNYLGGLSAGEGNVIAHNLGPGVRVTGDRNAILGNSIHSNDLIGIDLIDNGVSGVTLNDPGDVDSGGNDSQNFPVLTLASATPAPQVTLEGTLDSRLGRDYRIEFFASRACDPSGHGEGARYLGSTDQTTDTAGHVSFSVVLPVAVSDAESIVATATEVNNNTSEFGACLAAACAGLIVFAETLTAPDEDSLVWTTPVDIQFIKGPLAGVAGYATSQNGSIAATSALDISKDDPLPGDGVYYLVRPLGCGSWQTTIGGQPGRDTGLP